MTALLAAALAIAAIYFAITWAISVRIRNHGLLDVAFSYGVAIRASSQLLLRVDGLVGRASYRQCNLPRLTNP